jgi:hypothetical protein
MVVNMHLSSSSSASNPSCRIVVVVDDEARCLFRGFLALRVCVGPRGGNICAGRLLTVVIVGFRNVSLRDAGGRGGG